MAARPEDQAIGRTEVVRFVVDRRDDLLYFIDTRRFQAHYDFVRTLSRLDHPVVDAHTFEVREYERADRDFILGRVVHYLDGDLWTLELRAGDTLAGEMLRATFVRVRDALHQGAALRFRPVTEAQSQMAATLTGVPTLATSDVFASVRFQSVQPGVAFGFLRLAPNGVDPATIAPNQILVVPEAPSEIPVLSALVTTSFQAPLSHAGVLAQNRGTPFMALRGALDERAIVDLANRLVRLEITHQDYSLRVATQEEADAAWAALRPPPITQPALDDTDIGLRDLTSLRFVNANTVGAKAAALGEVAALGAPVVTPGGFVIPFHYYVEHLRRSGLIHGIQGMLADPTFRADLSVRSARLAELREAIRRAPIDRSLVRAVRRLTGTVRTPRVIFRSSTNAEDLPGFNGAGLYLSHEIDVDSAAGVYADAIRWVWSSVWSLGAFEERNWYGIDHARVAMAILVQPMIDDVVANGVGVTGNPYDPASRAYLLNSQIPGAPVTGARGGELPEQAVVHLAEGGGSARVELLSRSSSSPGAALLSEADYLQLADIFSRMHAALAPRYAGNVLDIEYLVRRNRQMVILQARPYRLDRRQPAPGR